MSLFKKNSIEGSTKIYSTMYLGGHPENPKKVAGSVDLQLLDNGFMLKHHVADRYFSPFEIPYVSVTGFEIVNRTLSTANVVLGGKDAYKLQQPNNIHITYKEQNGNEITIRLEMITGITIPGQAKVCLELLDYLKAQGIYAKFNLATNNTEVINENEAILKQIEKLSELRDANVLTEEEFNEKKAQLLNNIK